MKQALVLSTLLAVVYCGDWKWGFRVRFELNFSGFGSSYMYDMPKTLSDAQSAGWTKETRPADGHLPSLTVMYCHSPSVVCCIYDDNNYVAGMQIALSKVNFTDTALDMASQGFTEWTDSKGDEYWTISQYYVSEAFLATDKAERLASRISDKIIQQDSIWVAGMNNELYTIPNNTVDIANTYWTEQACIVWMGLHYYYNMTADTECTAESLLPWFPLYDDGTLVGLGMMNYGKMTTSESARDWFEHPAKSAVEMIVNKGPQCLYDIAESPGALTMHTYFVDDPRYILCLNN